MCVPTAGLANHSFISAICCGWEIRHTVEVTSSHQSCQICLFKPYPRVYNMYIFSYWMEYANYLQELRSVFCSVSYCTALFIYHISCGFKQKEINFNLFTLTTMS